MLALCQAIWNGLLLMAVASLVIHAIGAGIDALRTPKPTARELRKALRQKQQEERNGQQSNSSH
jgi:hypothetical protein